MIYGELTSPDLGRIARDRIALLPIAATEQHGPHLPVITDTALVSEVARRVHSELEQDVVLLPTLWVGSSHHHLGFPGTMSLRSETYINVLQDLAESLLATGFRKIVFLNGHGGNIVPLAEAIYRLTLSPRDTAPWIVGATYWLLEQSNETSSFMDSQKLTHACEYETSMMLALRVNGVKMNFAKGGQSEPWSKFYNLAGTGPSTVMVGETFSDFTTNGAMGHPEKATVEKGERLISHYARTLTAFLTEFLQWPDRHLPQSESR